MNVAAVQFKPTKGDKAASLERLVELARSAGAGSDLVVLPEMAVTGYVFADRSSIAPLAEPTRGPTYQALSAVARDVGCWIVAGFAERDGERFFNSALVIDPQGELHACYRKTMLYDTDKAWAEPGDSGYFRVDTGRGTFAVGICMDLNDERFVSWCRATDADAIAFPTNWLDQGENIWPYWVWRLRGIRSALVAANTYGVDETTRFIGRSAILQGNRLLAAAPATGDVILRAAVERRAGRSLSPDMR